MLQVFYLNVAIHACCRHMFQVFMYFIRILQVFHLDVTYVLQWFLSVFRRFRNCFICLLFYIAYLCLKSRSGVAHGKRLAARATFGAAWVMSGRVRRRGPIAEALVCCASIVRMLVPWIGCPSASKSELSQATNAEPAKPVTSKSITSTKRSAMGTWCLFFIPSVCKTSFNGCFFKSFVILNKLT
jgi:hypothetical protein